MSDYAEDQKCQHSSINTTHTTHLILFPGARVCYMSCKRVKMPKFHHKHNLLDLVPQWKTLCPRHQHHSPLLLQPLPVGGTVVVVLVLAAVVAHLLLLLVVVVEEIVLPLDFVAVELLLAVVVEIVLLLLEFVAAALLVVQVETLLLLLDFVALTLPVLVVEESRLVLTPVALVEVVDAEMVAQAVAADVVVAGE